MNVADSVESSVQVSVENIGGISETDVTLDPGVTILTGRNATNRTSLLTAIKAALGSNEVALKGDAAEGSVELTIGESTYRRTLTRRDGTVAFDGDPYLENSELADLFAFLLESNDARRAVEQGRDLYDVVMQPIDTGQIDAEIQRLQNERQELQGELEELNRLNRRLPELEEERTRLESAVDDKRAEIAATEAELDSLEEDLDQRGALEERFDELRQQRNRLERVRNDIEDEKRVIDALREDHADTEQKLDGLAESDAEMVRELESEINRLRERSEEIGSTLNQLQSAIQFNEGMLDDAHPALIGSLQDGDAGGSEGAVTDQLLSDDDEIVCWTCGSDVDRGAVEETVDLLRELHREKITERNALKEEIEELDAERKLLERAETERERLRREREEIESELEERTERLDELRSQASDLEETVTELEAAVDDLQSDDENERLALHRELTELGVELDSLEADLEAVEEEISSIEQRVEERESIEERIDDIDAEISELRSRIERIETDLVEQFNEHMEAILELLEFENLERVWIERVETSYSAGGRGGPEEAFDLHIIRTNDAGSVYEDTVDHLSESEREVVGLVFALSGYLVYEVYDQVPFMLLDSLEALDSGRIATLVEYIAEQADNLVVALLPEDAAAVDDSYHRLTEI